MIEALAGGMLFAGVGRRGLWVYLRVGIFAIGDAEFPEGVALVVLAGWMCWHGFSCKLRSAQPDEMEPRVSASIL